MDIVIPEKQFHAKHNGNVQEALPLICPS